MPAGMQVAPFWTMPQCDPMGPPVGAQFAPLQHRLGLGGDCGVQVNPGAHAPVESQRQPWLPAMHVEPTPSVPPPGAGAPSGRRPLDPSPFNPPSSPITFGLVLESGLALPQEAVTAAAAKAPGKTWKSRIATSASG